MKKRIFGLVLVVAIILNTFTFVSARTVYVNQQVGVNKPVEMFYQDGSSLVAYDGHTGYEPSKLNDGSMDTFCYNKMFNQNKWGNSSGHLAVIDLGGYYDITKIVLTPETTRSAAIRKRLYFKV